MTTSFSVMVFQFRTYVAIFIEFRLLAPILPPFLHLIVCETSYGIDAFKFLQSHVFVYSIPKAADLHPDNFAPKENQSNRQ